MSEVTTRQVGLNAGGALMMLAGIATLRGDLGELAKSVPYLSPWILLVVGLAIIVAANIEYIQKMSGAFVARWHFTPVFESVWPVSPTIRLHIAARKARDETVGGFIGKASEQLDWDGDPIAWCAASLGMPDPYLEASFRGPLRLYGKRFASNRRVLIPMEDRRAAHITDQGRSLTVSGEKTPLYTDLEILRSEMRARISYLKNLRLE